MVSRFHFAGADVGGAGNDRMLPGLSDLCRTGSRSTRGRSTGSGAGDRRGETTESRDRRIGVQFSPRSFIAPLSGKPGRAVAKRTYGVRPEVSAIHRADHGQGG